MGGGKSHRNNKEERPDGVPPPHYNGEEHQDAHDDSAEDRKKLWSKVSGLIGKDTTSLLSLPVSMFEPISVLQTMCEPLRYSHLIEEVLLNGLALYYIYIFPKVVAAEDPIDRICLVATFCIALLAGYNRTGNRLHAIRFLTWFVQLSHLTLYWAKHLNLYLNTTNTSLCVNRYHEYFYTFVTRHRLAIILLLELHIPLQTIGPYNRSPTLKPNFGGIQLIYTALVIMI